MTVRFAIHICGLALFSVIPACGLASGDPMHSEAWSITMTRTDPVSHSTPSDMTTLWQIGLANHDLSEFAVRQQNWTGYHQSGFFVVGRCDPAHDWPELHPGPMDRWAGRRARTARILFFIDSLPPTGSGELILDFYNTHRNHPPRLHIDLNGQVSEHQLPAGTMDNRNYSDWPEGGNNSYSPSSKGAPSPCSIIVPFSIENLRRGPNTIEITSVAGQWALYDCVRMRVEAGVTLSANPPTGTQMWSVESEPLLIRKGVPIYQPVTASIYHWGGSATAVLRVTGAQPWPFTLQTGQNVVEALVPPVHEETEVIVAVETGGRMVASSVFVLKPVRRWEIHLLHHTHLDIGWTATQSQIEQAQIHNIQTAIALARASATYPEGSRFRFHPEHLWAVDSYLRQATPAQKEEFTSAVRKGWICLDGLYSNQLTGLSKPEEMLHLAGMARELNQQYGFKIDTAMINDVPGYSWGLVEGLAKQGIRYLALGPNNWPFRRSIYAGCDQGGDTLTLGDQVFWWVSQSSKERVLFWMSGKGYCWLTRVPLDRLTLMTHLEDLEAINYPYDMTYLFHSPGGDNNPPDPTLADKVQRWNEQYESPRLIIGSSSELFHEFERRYGNQLPLRGGDFTPYWEFFLNAPARETALARGAAEILAQADVLWAMLDPTNAPTDDHWPAWRDVLLYNEHSLGGATEQIAAQAFQWKKERALGADTTARQSLSAALARHGVPADRALAIEVLNTSSWERSGLALLSPEHSRAGDVVKDAAGETVPSQRLSTGELAFFAQAVPPLGASRFHVRPGMAPPMGQAQAHGLTLNNGRLCLAIDATTGAITSLTLEVARHSFVASETGSGLNDYQYLAGADPLQGQRGGPLTVRVKEPGPLVASLLLECPTPDLRKLSREVRIVSGLDHLEIINTMDRESNMIPGSGRFVFPFNVPKGVLRMEMPWSVVRPDQDQLSGACKNFFPIQRWVDISGDESGVTWVTVDAPLIRVISPQTEASLLGLEDPWLKTATATQRITSLASWNISWTHQEGLTTFRYAIRPHRLYDQSAAQRFAIEQCQRLLAVGVVESQPKPGVPLRVSDEGVLVTSLKPSRDRRGMIVRLFNPSDTPKQAGLVFTDGKARQVWISNLNEERLTPLADTSVLAPLEVWTLRIEAKRSCDWPWMCYQ